jgi:hypothetical protein
MISLSKHAIYLHKGKMNVEIIVKLFIMNQVQSFIVLNMRLLACQNCRGYRGGKISTALRPTTVAPNNR